MRRQRPSSNPLPVDILIVLAELGVEVEKISGNEAWALCPGHFDQIGREDHGASWSINLETGAHNCFSCGWAGRFIDLVKKQQGLKGQEAEEEAKAWIRKHGGVQVILSQLRGEKGYQRKKAEEVTEADFVFFDDPPRYAREKRDVALVSCRAYGVKYDLDNDYWILPIREPFTGRLLGWQIKGKDYFNNHPLHLEKGKTLFGHHLLKGVREAYLEESPLDAVKLHTYSLEAPVSGYGVHVSDFQMDLIVDEVDRLYVCLDNDRAGRKKSKQIWAEYRHRTKLYFANYEHTDLKDHGEMSPEEIEESLVKAYSSLTFGRRFADR